MNELVFLDPNCITEEPFTTSKVIAKNTHVKHKNVIGLIRRYENDLKEFGRVTFETQPLMTKGGLQQEVVYRLNESQATLLITFMRNNDVVVKFKKTLVKQFYAMYKELTSRRATREIAKRSREALTNAIQELPESPHKQMKYKHYTDLVYKIVFSKTAKQLRDDYGITAKDNLRDYFTADENQRIEALENQISVLISLGSDYQEVKSALTKKYLMSA